MSTESMISLSPMDGGDPVSIPQEKTVIGRGSLLQITDKRVSRNHATLEVCDGKLVIVPIHTNPCFYKPNDSKTSVVLPKDKAKILQHGDVISLLPDKLLYKIVYKNPQESEEAAPTTGNNPKENKTNEEEKKPSKEVPPAASEKKDLNTQQPVKQNEEPVCKEGETEVKNGRHLPEWMVGAASRVKLNSAKAKNGTDSTKKVAKSKATSHMKPKKLDYHDDDEDDNEESGNDDDDDDGDDDEDDDDDDSFEAKKPRKRSSPQRSKRKPPTRRRYSEDDDDDGAKRRKRMPRAATQKAPKYTDDDFVMSDEEFVIEEDESEQSKGEDSDFVMDDADSGSDWETKGKNKSRSKVGRRKPTGRGRRGRYDSEEVSEEEDDDYRPRSTKKRGAIKKRKRRDSDEEEEDDDDDDDYRSGRKKAKRKPAPKNKRRSGAVGKKRQRSEDEEEDDENGFDDDEEEEKPKEKKVAQKNKKRKLEEEEDEEDYDGDDGADDGDKSVKTKKVPCQFGAECYRKNQKHLEEFSHPEKTKEEAEDLNAPRQKRAAALKQKEKLEAMHEASDEEEEMAELAA